MGDLGEQPQPLAANLVWLLAQTSHALKTELTAALESVGISPRAHHVLKTAMQGEYTQTELARIVGLDKTTMVVTLDDLEAAGLAERRLSATDRRARVVAVTKAGAARVRQAEAIAARVHDEVLETLPAGERKALLNGLARLAGGA
jgi:MarR family transcriptional regulator, transcriptional regulator for hemolysin